MRFGRLGAGALSFGFCVSLALVVGTGCSQSSPAAPAPASNDAPVGAITQGIQGGADDGTAHPFGVGVCAGNKGQCQGFCSGALILPNLVVTARHCVDDTTKIIDCAANPTFGGRHSQMWITTHNKMNQGTIGWHQVKSVVTPADDHVCGHDIALLILNDEVGDAEAKPAIPGIQYSMGDLTRYQRHFTALGYGNTSPQGFSAGTRRILRNLAVVCIPGDDVQPCPTGIDDNEFIGSDGTCEGDSGSSAFEDSTFTKGAPVSFGVLSRGGESDDGVFCKGSLYTRLDKWRDLVIDAAKTASNNWTLYPKPVPDWTVYVPPPPDAGAPDTGTKPPTALGDGAACTTNDDCKSKVCADTGSGKACTAACDESVVPTECQDGYVCRSSVCVQDPGEATPTEATPSTKTVTTSGCAVGGAGESSRGAPLGTLGLAAAAVLACGLRRRKGARSA